MGGKSDSPSQQVVKQDPWAGQQGYLKDVFGEAQNLYEQPGPFYYPYSGVAGLNPDILGGQDLLRNYALTGAQQQADQAAGAGAFGLTGAVLSPYSNPYLAETARAAIRPATETLLQDVLPNVGSAAQQAGAYGGARQGILESNVLNDYMRNVMDTSAGLYSQGYGQGLDYMGRSLALAPQTQAMGAMPAQYMDVVGQQLRAYEQQLIQDDIDRWSYYQQLPYTKLAEYSNAIQGSYGGTTTQPGPIANPLLGAAGGAMAGAGLASMIPALGPYAVPAAAIGALLGIL